MTIEDFIEKLKNWLEVNSFYDNYLNDGSKNIVVEELLDYIEKLTSGLEK